MCERQVAHPEQVETSKHSEAVVERVAALHTDEAGQFLGAVQSCRRGSCDYFQALK